jgi:Vitamin B6 photo-protection and homoeostasis
LDIDSKKWRLRADLLNDVALAIEVFLLPYHPEYSTYILCATSTMKALVGVAGGATRSALTQHHAIRGNLADVSSKDSAQETCVNLIASFVGLFMLAGIKSQMWLTVLFVAMTALHILANYRAVKAVCLRTFNEARFLIALEEFLKTGEVLTPRQVNRLESVTVGQTVYLTAKVKMGVTANTLLEKYQNSYDLESIIALFDTRDKFLVAETRKYLGVYLYCDARPNDILKAYFFAASYLQDKSQLIDRYWEIHNRWNEFANLARNRGWSTLSHLLPVDEYRLDWRI